MSAFQYSSMSRNGKHLSRLIVTFLFFGTSEGGASGFQMSTVNCRQSDPASSSMASNEEKGKRTMNERKVDAKELTMSDFLSQFRSAPDLLLGSSMRRRRSSSSNSPTKLIAEPASATGNEWQRRMMRSYEKVDFWLRRLFVCS